MYLPQCSVGRTFWSEAETRHRETRIEDRPQNLRDGLLDHPVYDRGNIQHPFTAAGFRDHYPSHRLGVISAIDKRLADCGPMRTCKRGKVLYKHPVDAGRALIGLHALPCLSHIRRSRTRVIRFSCKVGRLRPRRSSAPPDGFATVIERSSLYLVFSCSALRCPAIRAGTTTMASADFCLVTSRVTTRRAANGKR